MGIYRLIFVGQNIIQKHTGGMTLNLEDVFKTHRKEHPKFGFGDMGECIMLTKYSKLKDNGEKETWHDIVERVISGSIDILDKYINHSFSEREIEYIADNFYKLMNDMKFLPAGRVLANMGRPVVHEKELGAALNNCSFIKISGNRSLGESFSFVLDMSMLGAGVGIDITPPKYDGELLSIKSPINDRLLVYTVPDTREGWVEAIKMLIESYEFPNSPYVDFDYSKIRPKGSPIKGMGGKHSGYEPFAIMMNSIRRVLETNTKFTYRVLADISNYIGACIVSGGQRRTALLLMGQDDEEFLDLKDYSKYPERRSFAWTSNDSVVNPKDIDKLSKRIASGQDIGVIFLDNMRNYARMNGVPNNEDYRVEGVNPCAEMQLESMELCNLVEINPNNFESDEDAKFTIFYALLFAKIVSAMPIHWKDTEKIVQRNRRIGISQTGIAQYVAKVGEERYKNEMDEWYKYVISTDEHLSRVMSMERSVRLTTVKPSGTISKLMGVTPGIHFPLSKFIKRRMRIPKQSGYGEYYRSKGYIVEQDVYNKDTLVIEFPISYGNVKTIYEVSLKEQLDLAYLLQKHWVDNAVSITAQFTEKESHNIRDVINEYRNKLKVISFMKYEEITNMYEQVPEESITEEEYYSMLDDIERRKTSKLSINILPDSEYAEFCDSQSCENKEFENNVLNK